MSAVLARLVAAPKAVQAAVALGLLLAMIAAPLAIVWFAYGQIAQLQNETLALREELGRRQQIALQLPDLRASQAAALSGDSFLRATSISLARAELQARVSAMAGARSLTLVSVSNLSEIETSGITWVGLDLTVTGDNNALYRFVSDMENTAPPFVVSRFAARVGTSSQPEDLTLQIRIMVPFLELPT